MQISRGSDSGVVAPAEFITGDAQVVEIAAADNSSRTQIDSVRFSPGARTRWHRHPLGQVLAVTEGTGFVQRRGGPLETVRAGDTVRVEPGEWHWHGATQDTAMTHVAVEELPQDGRTAEFVEAVTDAEIRAGLGSDNQAAPGDGAVGGAAEAPLSRVIVMDQKLPEPLAAERVEIRRITVAPGYPAGLHVHNGPVFGAIETGSAIYQIEGEPEALLTPGDVFYEPEGVRIARFDAQDEGVTFLGYFLLAAGVNAELVFPDADR